MTYATTPSSAEPIAVFTSQDSPTVAKPPLVYCHQHATTVPYMVGTSGYMDLVRPLVEDFTVAVASLGYTGGSQDQWGNGTWRQRLDEVITLLSSSYGSTGKATLLGASMGGGSILGYTYANPTKVRSVAVAVPMISISDLKVYNSGQYASEIDTAYGGTYSDANQGPTYSPQIIGSGYPDTVPTAIWTASDDAVCRKPFSDAFVAANPTIPNTSVGALGHTEAAIFAASPGLIDWARGH